MRSLCFTAVKVARHFVQLKSAWERSASVVDAADAAAVAVAPVAPVSDMFWRRAIDPLSDR